MIKQLKHQYSVGTEHCYVENPDEGRVRVMAAKSPFPRTAQCAVPTRLYRCGGPKKSTGPGAVKRCHNMDQRRLFLHRLDKTNPIPCKAMPMKLVQPNFGPISGLVSHFSDGSRRGGKGKEGRTFLCCQVQRPDSTLGTFRANDT